jgi:hypothetical protein
MSEKTHNGRMGRVIQQFAPKQTPKHAKLSLLVAAGDSNVDAVGELLRWSIEAKRVC